MYFLVFVHGGGDHHEGVAATRVHTQASRLDSFAVKSKAETLSSSREFSSRVEFPQPLLSPQTFALVKSILGLPADMLAFEIRIEQIGQRTVPDGIKKRRPTLVCQGVGIKPYFVQRFEIVLSEVGKQRGHALVGDAAVAHDEALEAAVLAEWRGQRSCTLIAQSFVSAKMEPYEFGKRPPAEGSSEVLGTCRPNVAVFEVEHHERRQAAGAQAVAQCMHTTVTKVIVEELELPKPRQAVGAEDHPERRHVAGSEASVVQDQLFLVTQ